MNRLSLSAPTTSPGASKYGIILWLWQNIERTRLYRAAWCRPHWHWLSRVCPLCRQSERPRSSNSGSEATERPAVGANGGGRFS